jgi:hypothetical protein
MKTKTLRILVAAGFTASTLATAAPALAHDGGRDRFERREFRHEQFRQYERHFRPAPRVVIAERPAVVYRPAPVYAAPPAPVYYTEPAYYEPRHPNWGIVGGAIIGAVIGSQIGR